MFVCRYGWLNLTHPSCRAAERKRRQVYCGEVHDQLPSKVEGMDDAVPTIDCTPERVPDPPYSLERSDVDGSVPCSDIAVFRLVDSSSMVHTGLVRVLGDLGHFAEFTGDAVAVGSVKGARVSLERLIREMDDTEPGYDVLLGDLVSSGNSMTSIHRDH